MTLIGLIVFVLVVSLAWWACTYLMKTFEVPAKIIAVFNVLFVIAVVLMLMSTWLGGPDMLNKKIL